MLANALQQSERGRSFLDALRPEPIAEWPKPLALAPDHEKVPFPVDAFPAAIAAAVAEVQAVTQAPDSLVAFSALSTLSLAGQALADVQRSDSLVGPVSLYLLAIAESGERKTTVDRLFSEPIEEWQRAKREELEPMKRQSKADFAIWEAKKEATLNAIKSAKKGNKSTGPHESELRELERSEPVPVRWPQLKYADSTPEALAWDLAKPGGWPSGGILSSEAGIVLGSHGMGRDSIMRNLALLNALWDGASHTVNRRSSESFHIRGVRLTTGLAAQPDVVRAFIDSSPIARNIGFIARFLIAWPETNQGFRQFREATAWPHLDAFRARIHELLSMPTTMDERGALQPNMLTFSREAKAVWVRFYEDTETELRPGKSLSEMKDIASKAADNVARIAALFHLFQDGPTGNITEPDVTAAGRIVAWHLCEARRFLGDMATPEAAIDAKRLSDWLARYCREQKTASVNQRTAQAYGPVRKSDRFQKALAELEDAHHAARIPDGKKKLIQINPALLEE